jgi:hypothetical protein
LAALEVAVDDAGIVGVRERLACLQEQSDGLDDEKRAAAVRSVLRAIGKATADAAPSRISSP